MQEHGGRIETPQLLILLRCLPVTLMVVFVSLLPLKKLMMLSATSDGQVVVTVANDPDQ